MRLSRRGLIVGGLAGGGLAVGYLLRPREFPLPLEPGRGEIAFDAWIKIARDGVVTLAVPQLEMGQGVSTVLPQVIATELGADWRHVAVEPAPVSPHYANLPLAARWAKLWMPAAPGLVDDPDGPLTRRWAQDNRFMVTADGMSLEAYEGPAREAAATVRAMLAMAAAARWNVSAEECAAGQGFIVHGKRRLSFGELADEAAGFDPPSSPPLLAGRAHEQPSAMRAGAPLAFPRLDLPSKVDGSHVFAGDVRLPGMVYAAIRHGPVGDARLDRLEDEPAGRKTPGLISIVRSSRWLAAVASNWWAAEQALMRLAPWFEVARSVDSEDVEQALDRALRQGEGGVIVSAGEDEPDSDLTLKRRYDVAPALHATLETASAAARFSGGKLELWMATQAPEAARLAAAKTLGIDARSVVLYPMAAGGSFDRRLESDHAVEAALIAREIGLPVSLAWSRWQEHVGGLPRTPVAALLGTRTGAGGELTAWKARLALPATAREFGRRLFDGATAWEAIDESEGDVDALACEGALPPYAIPNVAIEHVPAMIGLPTARMRGNAHGYTCFFTESFVDEIAHAEQREPLSFRMAMLGHDVRLAECLQRAATMANWDGGAANSGQGLACHIIGDYQSGGRIAVIATARQDADGVRVERMSAVADIGRIVNVDIARQQIEGGLVFGIGLALGSSTGYERGLPTSRALRDLNLPLLADCPEIEVQLVDSSAAPADPGELGVAVAAPAIANALFSATGLRFRRLPLLSEGL